MKKFPLVYESDNIGDSLSWRSWCYFEAQVWKKDSSIVPSLFFSHFFIWAFSLFLWPLFLFLFFFVRSLIPTCGGIIVSIILSSLGQCSNNDDHHTLIYLQYLEQNMTLCECLRRCTGMCNDAWVTCMKNYEWWLCHKYDVNYMIMQSNMTMMERVIINGMVESCMAIYLGMAMEMP